MARGHVRKRGDSSYQAIVYAGIDPVTKRQRYLRQTAHTQREAERALTRLLSQVDEQRTPNTNATVGYLLDRWLELAQLELTTRDTYQAYLRRHVRPVLGGMPLRKLTVDVLDRFYLRLARHGGRCPRCMTRVAKGLAPLGAGERYALRPGAAATAVHEPDCAGGLPLAAATVRQVHSILHRSLDQAVRWGWITRNPASLASPPRIAPREVRPPQPEQVAALLNAAWARDPDFGTLLWLGVITGARRGELCALRWPHVDVPARELLIERNLVQRGRQRKEKATKTHQARRIALDEATMAILAEHRERCQQRAIAARTSLRGDGYVFSDTPGGGAPLLPDSVTQRFRRLARRHGVPATLHSFGRHYAATQLLAAGVDLRTVAGRLGHGGGGATTLRVYASFVAAADRRAAELLGQQLNRPGQVQPGHDQTPQQRAGSD
jgi:integrase